MHSLFLRIFLWFWLAMTLVTLALLITANRQANQLNDRWHRMTADAFSVYADSAADAHEDEQSPETRRYLADLEKRTGIQAWLFNTANEEVSGYAPRKQLTHPPQHLQQMRQLADRARFSGRTEFKPSGAVTLAARASFPINGRQYVLVGKLPTARFGPWQADVEIQALRLLALLTIAAAVCWGLGRYLTQPIVQLREATQQLADGNLDARPGAAMGRRRDELAGLAHDYDRMAERIKNLLEEQDRLVRAQRRLLGDVSHELRSPLARIGVAIELARDHNESGDTLALSDILSRIEREVNQQSEMIDRLLALARMESGLQQPTATPVDLAALVRAVAADADFEARPNNRSVRVTRCDACTTLGTLELLRSAIENTFRNAVRYTDEGTEVEVSLECSSESGALIRVLDHGPGVPDTELASIFRPFHRVEGARDRTRGGAGLGLAIAARAIEVHGGRIAAFNASDGGLMIELHLPTDSAAMSSSSTQIRL